MHVVVVGCGLAGISSAYYLTQAGVKVTVLERQAAPGRETSFANGAMLTPSLADPWNSPGVFGQLVRNLGRTDSAMLLHLSQLPVLARWGVSFLANARRDRFQASYLNNAELAQSSQMLLEELRAETGIDFEFQQAGTLKIFEDPEALGEAEAVAKWLQQIGVSHRRLNVDELIQLEPTLRAGAGRLAGAIHYPDDQVGNARLYCERLAAWLVGAGVQFRFDTRVSGFTTEGRRIRAVETAAGPVAADAFVLAAGSFSPALASNLKLRIPVVPAKGYSITLASSVQPRYPVVDDALHAAVVPLGGVLRVAGTAEFAGFDSTVRPDRIENLTRLLKRVYPEVNLEGVELNAWMGLRPMPADGRPLLGQLGPENLYLNTGHGALGWTLANASAKVVAQQILGERPSINATPFLASRISHGT